MLSVTSPDQGFKTILSVLFIYFTQDEVEANSSQPHPAVTFREIELSLQGLGVQSSVGEIKRKSQSVATGLFLELLAK